jgi:hypothetical protein
MIIRQGDVLIIKVNEINKSNKTIKPGVRGYVVADGEATGHQHVITETQFVNMFKCDGEVNDFEFEVTAAVDMVHEEHAPVTIPPGQYVSRIQREYSPEEIRRVID